MRLSHRLKAALTAGSLTLGIAGTTVIAAPSEAFAANGPCSDIVYDQPTPLHQYPSSDSTTLKFLDSGHNVTGNCKYIYNTTDPQPGTVFMMVNYIGPGNQGGWAYIAIQHLDYGYYSECVDNGGVYSIGSGTCPLYYQSWG